MNYLKVGSASELTGKDKKIYRFLELVPGFLSWGTLLVLLVFSYFKPVMVAYFIIAFDVYWLLLVIFLSLHLILSYQKTKKNIKIDWREKCQSLYSNPNQCQGDKCLAKSGLKLDDIVHLMIFPIYNEDISIIRPSVKAIAESTFPGKNIILVLTVEERGGKEVIESVKKLEEEYATHFRNFFITIHPKGIAGEAKGKGANQAWAAEEVKREIIDKEGIDYKRIIVSVFDIDTIIYPGYFYALTYHFLTVENPYRMSFQPIPIYHNNVWQAPFFARVAASSNTFWQMMQQLREEKLATYSSHSMSWQALCDVGFWSKTMVSEDSRIFWHCFCHYNGDYNVKPLYYPVSMDVTMDETTWQTAKSLYKQQRRWGWGVENIPYLVFNTIKRWKDIPKTKFINRIFVQFYGFHSWATNALIIGIIGWMPMLLGGDRFNSTVLSSNLPVVTRTLMMIAMSGLVLSAILSTLFLPKKPKNYPLLKYLGMLLQWIILPISIIIFGSVPGLEAQTRMMLGGKFRLGFFVTPKSR